tara:strand:+ start:23613 stop:23933 length:321 start_codon:yes stop_codon:yes gene_type:complete
VNVKNLSRKQVAQKILNCRKIYDKTHALFSKRLDGNISKADIALKDLEKTLKSLNSRVHVLVFALTGTVNSMKHIKECVHMKVVSVGGRDWLKDLAEDVLRERDAV